MTPWVLGAFVLGVAVFAAWLTHGLSLPGSRLSILDVPNERSLHVRPTPRTGGLAIITAIAVSWFVVARGYALDSRFAWIAGGTLTVAAVSYADDRGGISARYRFLVHLSGAVMLLAADLAIERVPLPGVNLNIGMIGGAVTTVFFVVWMTNLYNFMDGMDGFAGGMSVAGFGFLGAGLWIGGDVGGAAAALVIASSSLGFLRYNFPPARIFLGDVGSAPLGFLAAALMLHGNRTHTIPLWASAIVFSPFIVDATVTLARRATRGEKIWQPHRSHYYQRLVQLGWGHRRTVLCEYLVMVACSATAIVTLDAGITIQRMGLISWASIYVVAMVAISRLERSRVTR